MLNVSRHESVFDPVKWGQKRVDVIGVGATGSHVALGLAKLGVQNLHVWDDDVVEEHNLANQVYGIADIGAPKVAALQDHIAAATGAVIKTHRLWSAAESRNVGKVIFCMVDSMAARQEIFDTYGRNPMVNLIVDSRMGAAHGQLLTYKPGDRPSLRRYQAMLFSDDDADVEVSACGTAITVGPTAQIIVGYALWAFINHAAERPFLPEIAVMAQDPGLMVV